MAGRVVHGRDGTAVPLAVLKSPAYGERPRGGPLPYRIDLLENLDFDLAWTDRHLRGSWARIARTTERFTMPWVQAFLGRSLRSRSAATLAMFESEAHGLALWRLLSGSRRPPLVVIGCWLADLVERPGPRRSLYRWLYRSVDMVIVYSSNQERTLVQGLGIHPSRVRTVRFGVDTDELAGLTATDSGTVVAAGRDLGRDWDTLLEAAEGTGWEVRLITRPSQVDRSRLPPEVTFEGKLDRATYLDRLAQASVVVIPTEVRQYPTGQTVLLEAMALGKACVVTDTPAMREYVSDGDNAILVPPRDADALRAAVSELLSDEDLRRRIGTSAQKYSDESGGAEAMWAQIADGLTDVVSARNGLGQ